MNDVPYIVHEGITVKLERTIKRLWILCIIMFITFVVSNGLWIWYESQWLYVDTTTTNEVTQDASWESGDVILNGTGEVNLNGQSTSDN